MAMDGDVTFESDMRGLEFLDGATVPRRVVVHMAGRLGDPDASVLFEVRDGVATCVELIVKAKRNGRGLRGADLGELNLDALAERAFLDFATPIGGGAMGGKDEGESRLLRKGIEKAVYATGRGLSEAELQEVARIYREHAGTPTAAVHKLLGYNSRRTADRRVRQARDAGLL